MKLMIDIPEVFYEYCKAQEDAIEIQLAVKNGIPLDNLRAEIDGIEINGQIDDHTLFIRSGQEVKKIALEIIDKYKGEPK